MTSRFTELCIDCADPQRLAAFWAAVLDWQVEPDAEDDNEVAVVDPQGKAPLLLFARVPEPKTVKNRLHVDLSVAGGLSTPIEERRARSHAESRRLQALGARELWINDDWRGFSIVMADPEGNEFCVH